MKEQEDSARLMGAKEFFKGGFPDTELTDSRDLILTIEDVVQKVGPDTVMMNYWDDVHQDHRAAANAALSATRYVREVLFYEVPSTRNFEPDTFVDIASVLEEKIELLKAHASQVDRTRIQNLSILESAQSCANFRGYQGRVKYAEGFKALRILKDIE